MARLCDLERQIIRSAPPGSSWLLAQRFGVSVRYVVQLQAGKRGLPIGNGLGARPWKLTDRRHAQEWHRKRIAQADAALARALQEIEAGEAFTPTAEAVDRSGLFKGTGAGKRHATPPRKPPGTDYHGDGKGKPANLLYDRR